MHYYREWDVFLIYLVLSQAQKFNNKSLLSLEKIRNIYQRDFW